ncbi:cupin domain-containing protein [Sphaerotilaceae bacterium SBD11-9]
MNDSPTDKAQALRQQLIRNFNDVALRHDIRPPLYDSVGARLAEGTAAQKLGASIDTVAPGMRSCPYHFHYAQEEMFIVLEGEGTLRVAGEMLPIRAGDVMFIPPGPDYPHQIINTSAAPLKYLSISTKDNPEIVEYPDSGKYLASAARGGDPFGFARMHQEKDDLDYWHGEP